VAERGCPAILFRRAEKGGGGKIPRARKKREGRSFKKQPPKANAPEGPRKGPAHRRLPKGKHWPVGKSPPPPIQGMRVSLEGGKIETQEGGARPLKECAHKRFFPRNQREGRSGARPLRKPPPADKGGRTQEERKVAIRGGGVFLSEVGIPHPEGEMQGWVVKGPVLAYQPVLKVFRNQARTKRKPVGGKRGASNPQ